MQLVLQIAEISALLQIPLLMLVLGVLIVLFAFMGTRAARGPATFTPFAIILMIGLLMIVFALLGIFL